VSSGKPRTSISQERKKRPGREWYEPQMMGPDYPLESPADVDEFGLHLVCGIPREGVGLNTPIEGTSYRAADIALNTDYCPWNGDRDSPRGHRQDRMVPSDEISEGHRQFPGFAARFDP
jgi:hypothetical protein